jgi:hypothetical protein
VLVIEAFGAHEVAHDAAISRNARHCNAHVVIDFEDLVQRGGQLGLRSVQSCEHHITFPLQATALPT